MPGTIQSFFANIDPIFAPSRSPTVGPPAHAHHDEALAEIGLWWRRGYCPRFCPQLRSEFRPRLRRCHLIGVIARAPAKYVREPDRRTRACERTPVITGELLGLSRARIRSSHSSSGNDRRRATGICCRRASRAPQGMPKGHCDPPDRARRVSSSARIALQRQARIVRAMTALAACGEIERDAPQRHPDHGYPRMHGERTSRTAYRRGDLFRAALGLMTAWRRSAGTAKVAAKRWRAGLDVIVVTMTTLKTSKSRN